MRLNLGAVLVDLGRAGEAEVSLREVENDMIEVLGESYGPLAAVWRARGRALDALGRSTEALALFDRSIQRWTEIYGVRSQQVALSLERKATALRHLGRLPEAEAITRQALDTHLALLGDDHNAARMRSVLGNVLLDEGRAEQARDELVRALAVEEKFLLPTHPDLLATRAALVRAEAKPVRHE
jgi:tetratricopeptide (TPR) repeat protein